jgi:hypothetical protein
MTLPSTTWSFRLLESARDAQGIPLGEGGAGHATRRWRSIQECSERSISSKTCCGGRPGRHRSPARIAASRPRRESAIPTSRGSVSPAQSCSRCSARMEIRRRARTSRHLTRSPGGLSVAERADLSPVSPGRGCPDEDPDAGGTFIPVIGTRSLPDADLVQGARLRQRPG